MQNTIPDPKDLPPMEQYTLDDIIEKHGRYLRGQKGGARAVIQYRNLSELSFKGNDLSQADFTGSMLIGADLTDSNFSGCSFFACDLRNANIKNANLSRCDLRGAYVAGANLTGADLRDADMREGKIMKRDKRGILEDRKRLGGEGARTVFSGAKLTDTKMNGAQAMSVDFTDADLTGVDLSSSDLSGANFEGANLADVDLSGANISFANMRKSIITGVILDDAETQGLDRRDVITEADMGNKIENLGKTLHELLEEHTLWVATAGEKGRQLDLSGYDLRDVIDLRKFPFTAIHAKGSNFLNQNLEYADLQSANFDRADFRDCNLKGADLRGSSFKYAMFTRADLSGAKLCPLEFKKGRWRDKKHLQRSDLSGANLRYASLEGADMRDCIMMGADLTNANLKSSDLRRADLTGAILNEVNLRNTKLEDTVIDLEDL